MRSLSLRVSVRLLLDGARQRDGQTRKSGGQLVVRGLHAKGRESARDFKMMSHLTLKNVRTDSPCKLQAMAGAETLEEVERRLQAFAVRQMQSKAALPVCAADTRCESPLVRTG